MNFNLIDEPWIPVSRNDGSLDEVGIRTLFEQAHNIRDINAGTRFERLAILRMLVALTMRVFPDWEYAWENGEFDMDEVSAYLDDHHDRFELFGDKPFYQERGVTNRSDVNVSLLGCERFGVTLITTNQTLWHSMAAGTRLTPAQAIRGLLYFHSTTPSGAQPGMSWAPPKSGPVSWSASPSSGITGMCAVGDSLYSTILLNYPPVEVHENDLPAWERGPIEAKERSADGTIDLLTWQSRSVELVVDDENMVVGFYNAPGYRDSLRAEDLRSLEPNSVFKSRLDTKEGRLVWSTETFKGSSTAIGGLHALWNPNVEHESLVQQRCSELRSHVERFQGYEFALLRWDGNGAKILGSVEDAINIPYGVVSSPDTRRSIGTLMNEVFSWADEMDRAVYKLTGGKTIQSGINATHRVDAAVRYAITQENLDSDSLRTECARIVLDELNRATMALPISTWADPTRRSGTVKLRKHLVKIVTPKETNDN